MKVRLLFFVVVISGLLSGVLWAEPAYRWLAGDTPRQPIETASQRNIERAIPPPDGFERVPVPTDSFANWLRHLPLKPSGTPVLLYNGSKKANQEAHHAVLDIDTGSRDLQQCADAVIRLRAEYLYSTGDFGAIHFRFTSGDEAKFNQWADGYRPVVVGNWVRWIKRAPADWSYASFRHYLDVVFSYAGTLSLSKELSPQKVDDISIGDVFIHRGSPGHAAIVVDLAVTKAGGKKVFLLAQGYMPAQDIHILRNPASTQLSPWYGADFGETLETPEWTFAKSELMQFPPTKEQAGDRHKRRGTESRMSKS